MQLKAIAHGFEILQKETLLFRHTEMEPGIFLGTGRDKIKTYHGNFSIEDYVESRMPVQMAKFEGETPKRTIDFSLNGRVVLHMDIDEKAQGDPVLHFRSEDKTLNRFWLRLPAEAAECDWGCGEQMSYFNLRGHHFPLWTSEPGVGRDKSTTITFQADVDSKSGGDYYNTNYPQPTFVSSRHYACHVDSTAYADFDFRQECFHELQLWEIPAQVEFFTGRTFLEIIEKLSARFGRQMELPKWLYNGAVLGLKGGEEKTFSRMENAIARGLPVAAVWSEDWAGIRVTSFGKRLFWDWKWNKKRYPHLAEKIQELYQRNIRFMNYVSPYLCSDGELFLTAKEKGLFALDGKGEVALVDFGEFACGVIDFTKPEACEWFKKEIIGKNMIEIGVSGWMADFGEYLPTDDIYLANGVSAKLMHNDWPRLWAKVNAEAVADYGRTGDILFFMRAGATGVQRYCPMLWAGDQSVDFSRHDGLNTVICGALSAGILGNAYYHSDIGGYTSLYGNRRTKELFDRWVDMAAFTSMMRTHEGNRPDENFQFDQDADSLEHFARMTRIHCHMAPYIQALSKKASVKGYPVQRPLFVHFEQDRKTYAIQDEYLFGPDMLVAPIHQQGVRDWKVYLPLGVTWVNVWNGQQLCGGQYVTVPALIGWPPLFYRQGSSWHDLFDEIKNIR
jgi:alpha-glucosidase